jgi:glycosyltransferase involved in cell wall biosynthesis
MKSESAFVSSTGPVSGESLTLDESSPHIIVFIAGEQSCVQAAVLRAGQLYRGHVLFVCEPRHYAWLPQDSDENIFIVEQPFNPFGQTAGILLRKLQARPTEACALVVADLGFESFRFRLFALRLSTTRFYLLRTGGCTLPKPIGRTLFALLAGITLFLRIILKAPGLDAFQKNVRTGLSRGLPKGIGQGILRLSKTTNGDIRRLPKSIVWGIPALPKIIVRGIQTLLKGASRSVVMVSKTIGVGILSLLRAIRQRCVAWSKAIGQRLLALLATILPPLDQPFAIGLAWLARICMLLRSSQIVHSGKQLVHVIPSIGMGGVQRQLVLLLKNRSPDYNHRVVVLRSEDRFFAPELSECGVGVYYLDSEEVRSALALSPGQQPKSGTPPFLKVVTSSLPFCSEIAKLSLFLRGLNPRPDLVHCWLLYANLAGSIAARLAKIPLVVTSVRNIQSEVNYNYYDPRWQRALERATAPLANAITANAPAVAADYKAFAGARSEQVVTVPNGVDIRAVRHLNPQERAEKRQALGLAPEDVVVGTVARLAKEKDFETFLRAVALARGKLPMLCSMIIGEGPLRVHLESFASSLGLTNVVRFLGERKDVGDLIQCFDVFLLTSVIEGMPNVVMESQLLGVPVVATRAGGTVDLIRDGETGLLAPIGDYRALASCIVRLFTESGLWGRISLAASQQIREGYTIEQLVARTENVYRDLLDPNAERIRVRCAE